MFVARRIEDNFSKQKIMELYLNRIYFGGGLYGAEAAARGYFDKPAHEMTLAECATLAGLIKSPNKLSPWTDREASTRGPQLRPRPDARARFHQTTRNSEARRRRNCVVGNRQNARGQNYAIDYIRQQVIAAVGWDRAMSDGFRIHTTIDARPAGGGRKIAPRPARRGRTDARLRPSNLRPICRSLERDAGRASRLTISQKRPRPGLSAGRGHRAR